MKGNEFEKNEYAVFDAMSLRNIIIEKLNSQGTFTDQNYVGSNLASIIDIISYAFNTLIFYLNKTASESSFTEAQLRENINRIVKLIGYNPTGFQTSVLTVGCSAVSMSPGLYTLQRYSYIVVNSVAYSIPKDVSFFVGTNSGVYSIDSAFENVPLFQGLFREYPTLFAEGIAHETFTLLFSDTKKIDHLNFDVYVFEEENNKWFQYKEVASLAEASFRDRSFERRLNENGNYEIKFGDGIQGRKLSPNDQISIFYLECLDDSQGAIGPLTFNQTAARKCALQSLQTILSNIHPEKTYLTQAETGKLKFTNFVGSTNSLPEENVEQIRERAPKFFLTQNRLVTANDYKIFIEKYFSHFVADIKVLNNWEYISSYFKYFNDLKTDVPGFANLGLLNHVKYADSCNFNNVYLCLLPRPGKQITRKFLTSGQKANILADLTPHKMLTTEIVFLEPIYKAVSFGISKTQNFDFEAVKANSFLVIKKHERSKRNSNAIIKDVVNCFVEYFRYPNNTLGQTLQNNKLLQKILSVEGVSSVYTKNEKDGSEYIGLSLLVWNPDFPEKDKQIVYTDLAALPCEYFYVGLKYNELISRILVETTPTTIFT